MLEEGVRRLGIARRQRVGQAHDQLAEQELGVASSTLYSWRRGEHLPEPTLVVRLARTFVRGWGADQKWVNDFLDAADYGPVRAVEELNQELFGANARDIRTMTRPEGYQRVGNEHRGTPPWTLHIFEWLISAGRVTEGEWLRFISGLGLWLLGWWIIRPFFAWPFPDTRTALSACTKYGTASLMLPLFISLLSGIGHQDVANIVDCPERWKLWILRCSSAYVAYHIAMVVFLSASVILYSAGLWPLPTLFGLTGLALVLLFAYAISKQFPATRIDDRTQLRFYPSLDILVLVTFIAFGPLIAAFFALIVRPWLFHQYLTGLILLCGIILAITTSILEKKTGKTLMLAFIAFEVIVILAVIVLAVIDNLA